MLRFFPMMLLVFSTACSRPIAEEKPKQAHVVDNVVTQYVDGLQNGVSKAQVAADLAQKVNANSEKQFRDLNAQ